MHCINTLSISAGLMLIIDPLVAQRLINFARSILARFKLSEATPARPARQSITHVCMHARALITV